MADRLGDEMHKGAREAWRQFVDQVEPHRADLARYCRRLTGDVWNAEDLAQDALMRAFAILGSVFNPVTNTRAYLLRIATNLWIDAERRRVLEAGLLADAALEPPTASSPTQELSVQVRDAGGVLMRRLAPQERAAVLLKDVLDLSLDETAQALGTTTGAVKAALHRGRGRLKDVEQSARRAAPDPAVVDEFARLYNVRDLNGLLALMLDTGSTEMSGINNEFGREGFEQEQGWFHHTVVGFPGDYEQPEVRWERREFRSEPLIVQLHRLWGEAALTSVIRLETVDGKVARVRCYTFNPDAVREVGAELGLNCGPLFYSFPPFLKHWQEMPPEALR
jgi:RNA polymerase sigma-70 factor, ECF subfamily